MPNMFGGDQFHPAYDPRTRVEANQVLVGNDLYTVNKDGSVELERVDGSGGIVVSWPSEVQVMVDKVSR